jgi:hypothetical protein
MLMLKKSQFNDYREKPENRKALIYQENTLKTYDDQLTGSTCGLALSTSNSFISYGDVLACPFFVFVSTM